MAKWTVTGFTGDWELFEHIEVSSSEAAAKAKENMLNEIAAAGLNVCVVSIWKVKGVKW